MSADEAGDIAQIPVGGKAHIVYRCSPRHQLHGHCTGAHLNIGPPTQCTAAS